MSNFDPDLISGGGGTTRGGRQPTEFGDTRLVEHRGDGGVLSVPTPTTTASTFLLSGGAIPVEQLFGPLKAEIDALTQQQIQAGRASISVGAERAEEFARESLAGTNLGQSGIAAGTFSKVGQEAAQRIEQSDQEARIRGDTAKLDVDRRIAELQFGEELRRVGMNEEDIRSATNFRRQLDMMKFRSSLEIAANEPSWWEEWGPIFEMIGSIGGSLAGNPAIFGGSGEPPPEGS